MMSDSSDRKKVLVLLGTRPEVIKLAPVIMELEKRKEFFSSFVCSTGQHRQMLDQAMGGFGLKADLDLELMTPGQSLARITSMAINALDTVLSDVKPDMILVQGDTTSAMCGALCGFYHRIPVGHVEAGLRTGQMYSPFPEEVNRSLIGRMAALHFCPTGRAATALAKENVPAEAIHITGNTVVDALKWMESRLPGTAPDELAGIQDALTGNDRMILVTGHRRESFGDGMASICRALRKIADANSDVQIIYPVHLNPAVQKPVQEILSGHPRIHLLQPLAYPTMIWLMRRAHIILTDSGGIQEEAPSFGKPLLIMRETTERPEVIEAGAAKLVGTDEQTILTAVTTLLSDDQEYAGLAGKENPFGDGTASQKIMDAVDAYLSK